MIVLNCGRIPTRYVVILLLFAGAVNIYIVRVNLNVAIVAMVNNTVVQSANKTVENVACPELLPKSMNQSSPSNYKKFEGTFDWDIETQSAILGALYYGSTFTHFPSSLLVQRYGAKWFYGLSVFITSLLTFLIPVASYWGVTALVVVRVVQGISQGAVFPALNVLISRWVPKTERSFSFSFVYTGATVGVITGMILSGILAESDFFGGWPSVFYTSGVIGLVWFLLYIILVYETPYEHPRISEAEIKFIEDNKSESKRTPGNIPWIPILTSAPMWAMNLAIFGEHWGDYMLIIEMPTYISNILHFDVQTNGFSSAAPHILLAVTGLISGRVADKLSQSGKFTTNVIRKLMNSIAFFGTGACLLLVAFVGCRPVFSVTLICLGMALNGFVFSGCEVAILEMSPDYTETISGITFTFASATGFLTAYVVGVVTSSGQTVKNWNLVFIITAGVYFFTGIVFDVWGTAEAQPWGRAAEKKKQTNTETSFVSDGTQHAPDRTNNVNKF